MKQVGTLTLGAVLIFALVGCGDLVRNMIATQPAPNALHLDGLPVVTSSAPLAASVSPQAARTPFTAEGEVRFPDIDWADIQSKAPLDVPIPRSYHEMLGMNEADIVLVSPVGDAPSELVLEGMTVALRFSNASGPPVVEFSLGSGRLPVPVTLERIAVDAMASHYQVDPASAEALRNLIEIKLDGAKFKTLFEDILTNEKPQAGEADQNRLAASVSVWLSSPDGDGTLAGSQFMFRIATHGGVLDWTK
jgi:hypothetical protein